MSIKLAPIWTVVEGECREVMRGLEEESFDSVCTDPPYEIGFMGRSWDSAGVAFDPETWAEVLRLLKPGAHALIFGGTRTYHRMVCAVEDAGFEIRDCITALRATGFAKSKGVLKPAVDLILLARKPGRGILNTDACRVPSGDDHRDKCESVIGLGSNRNGVVYGEWNGDRESSWDPRGRRPANLVFDDEAAAMLDASVPASTSRVGKQRVGVNGDGWGMTLTGDKYDDSGGPSRFFFTARVSSKERVYGLDERCPHPSMKPVELMRWLVRLSTPAGGTVLDPFAGSGSTIIAATLEGFDSVGIDQEQEYVEVARKRVAYWAEHGVPK